MAKLTEQNRQISNDITATNSRMSLTKSKQRIADHGEVFTPAWMVEAMLDLVKEESERIDSRFLEPACGSGNFLVRVLQRKLAAVELKFGLNFCPTISLNAARICLRSSPST
jgi:type I restriction-modification system DNA methylase subunit